MAKKRRRKSSKRKGGKIPLPVLKKRLKKLAAIVQSRS